MARARRRERPPKTIRCANLKCGRVLLADPYRIEVPTGKPPEIMHWQYEPDLTAGRLWIAIHFAGSSCRERKARDGRG